MSQTQLTGEMQAGTEKHNTPLKAPAAIAAERLGLTWTAIDSEPEARDAHQRRFMDEEVNRQETLA